MRDVTDLLLGDKPHEVRVKRRTAIEICRNVNVAGGFAANPDSPKTINETCVYGAVEPCKYLVTHLSRAANGPLPARDPPQTSVFAAQFVL